MSRLAAMPSHLIYYEYRCHHQALIDVVPALRHHAVKSYSAVLRTCHQILVEQTAARSRQCCQHKEAYPLVVAEVNAFLPAASRKQEQRNHCKNDTGPLPAVQPFSKYGHCSHKRHHRTCGIDGTDNRQGEMCYGEIAEYP